MHSSRKYTYISSYGHKISAVVLTLALAACPGKEDGTDTDATTGDATTDSGETTSESTAPTTGGEETGPATTDGTGSATDGSGTAGMTETGDPVTTGAPDDTTTAGMTSETGDTETGGAGPVEECMAACSKIASCDPMRLVEVCTQACADEYAGSPACTTAGGDLAICIAGLDCEQIALLEDEDPMVCGQQFLAADEACSGLGCGFVSGVGPGQCSLSHECNDGPIEAYECEKDICTCSVDGVAGVSCPAMQFCRADIESQQQMAAECCGFIW